MAPLGECGGAVEREKEWGSGGSVVYEPDAGRGLRMGLGASVGAMGSGAQNLWTIENASGLMRGVGVPFGQRLDAEVGYGFGRGALWYPYVVSDAFGQKRFGVKLSAGSKLGLGLEFGRMGGEVPDNAMLLRSDIGF